MITHIKNLAVILHVLLTQLILKLTNIQIYQIDITYCQHDKQHYCVYSLKEKRYYSIHQTPFVNDQINHSYKKPMIEHSIRKGKLIDGKVLLS